MPVIAAARYSCGSASHRHRFSTGRSIDTRFNLRKQTEQGELYPLNHATN
jgi:hypothetical protein